MPGRSVLRLATVATALGALGCLWAAWCEFPLHPWNDIRLAPAFALRHGTNPYPGAGEGPLFTWIYGPVPLLLQLPATCAASALGAIQAAWVINVLTLLLPLAVIFFGTPELRARGPAAGGCALGLAVLLLPRSSLLFHVADHAAVAAGLLSCWCLARDPRPSPRRLAAAAALCALAVWSKQIAVFLVPAQLVFLALSGGRRRAAAYLGWVAVWGLAGLAASCTAFGWRNLWLNLVTIPGGLPWAEATPRLTLRVWSLVGQLILPTLLLLGLHLRGAWPARDTVSGRFLQLTSLAAAFLTPLGVAAFLKIGGDTNALHAWDYLMPAFLLTWLAREPAVTPGGQARLLLVVAAALGLRAGELTSLPPRAWTGHFVTARQLGAATPGGIWFPQNPVLSFYASGRIWHSEDGVITRYLAGHATREPDFRRHLPPQLAGVAYPAAVTQPPIFTLLPEFSHAMRGPHWTLHLRPPPGGPP
jgi:hypothetical protein